MCIVDGCGKQTQQGRAYCDKHQLEVRRGIRPKVTMPKAQQAAIQSDCCNASCSVGERHEYGEQYCKKCGNACCWSSPIVSRIGAGDRND